MNDREFVDLMAREHREIVVALDRQIMGETMLGAKGVHFDGDEWERRADEWYGRVCMAESQFAARMGWR